MFLGDAVLSQDFSEKEVSPIKPNLVIRLTTPDAVIRDVMRTEDTLYRFPLEIGVYDYSINIELDESVESVGLDFIKFQLFTKEVDYEVPVFFGEIEIPQSSILATDKSDRNFKAFCRMNKIIIDAYEKKFGKLECRCLVKIHRVFLKKSAQNKEGQRGISTNPFPEDV